MLDIEIQIDNAFVVNIVPFDIFNASKSGQPPVIFRALIEFKREGHWDYKVIILNISKMLQFRTSSFK